MTKRALAFWLILIGFVATFVLFAALLARSIIEGTSFLGFDLQGIARRRYEAIAENVVGIYDTTADAAVGRLLQRNIEKSEAGVLVRSNNAGLRNSIDYGPKASGVYRIVILGDSFTYGFGGLEEDRYSNQISDILTARGVTVGGKSIEIINIGISSWTAFNEASYLTTRLSAYQPDLIVVLTVSNDISDTQGVRGIGVTSNEFSPEHRTRGSGVFNNAWPSEFGVSSINLLTYDIGPESQSRWRKAASAFARLESLQHAAGGRIFFTVLQGNGYFEELFHYYMSEAGVTSPVGYVSYQPFGEDNRLPHDPHPNRNGHRHVALQTLGHLGEMGWLEFESSDPPVPRWRAPSPDVAAIEKFRTRVANQILKSELDFSEMSPNDTRALLGGVMPSSDISSALRTPPFVAPYAAFLLLREPQSSRLKLRVRLPDRPELFPLQITMTLQGQRVTKHRFEETSGGKQVELEAPLPLADPRWPGVEVRLESNRHYSEIGDDRTISFQLLSAKQE